MVQFNWKGDEKRVMIIVSQDREAIINFERIANIWISKDTTEYFEINADGELLGTYKTKERAKEVLQEIARKYTSYTEIVSPRVGIKQVSDLPKSYIMPEEQQGDKMGEENFNDIYMIDENGKEIKLELEELGI